jgi:muconolactone delta-isomerase
MKFIVVAVPNREVDRAPLQAEETHVVQKLRRQGVIERIYVRVDGAASYSVMEADSLEEVHGHISSLPFAVHGAMTVDVIEVREV